MSQNQVTREGLKGTRPGREAVPQGWGPAADGPSGHGTGGAASSEPGRRRRRGAGRHGRRGEQLMVPDADFRSYYGEPILQPPVWEARTIATYFFLGGLAGASSVVAAGAQATGRPRLAAGLKAGSFAAITTSLGLLVEDLGRPLRAPMMLRVLKPTSPMSIGTWIVSGYAPMAGAAAVSAFTGKLPRIGALATGIAGVLGPAVASYTAVLAADTAVPAWHDAHRELPFVFTSSAAAAAGGLGMLVAPVGEAGPARRAGIGGGLAELAASEVMQRRIGLSAKAYESGRAGVLRRLAQGFTVAGVAGTALLGRRSRVAAAVSGACLMAGSACTRFAVFEAGRITTQDPRYVVEPQRRRIEERRRLESQAGPTTS